MEEQRAYRRSCSSLSGEYEKEATINILYDGETNQVKFAPPCSWSSFTFCGALVNCLNSVYPTSGDSCSSGADAHGPRVVTYNLSGRGGFLTD
eukprot:6855118-Pyramimonas_sp.AAC.2